VPTSHYDEDEYEIRLKLNVRDLMAQAARAAGEQITPGHHGQPSGNALIRKTNGVARSLFNVRARPHNTSLARIGVLHGKRRGIDAFDALRELCVVVNLRTGEVVDLADMASHHESRAAA
jgi:hypothetical protein